MRSLLDTSYCDISPRVAVHGTAQDSQKFLTKVHFMLYLQVICPGVMVPEVCLFVTIYCFIRLTFNWSINYQIFESKFQETKLDEIILTLRKFKYFLL